MGVIECLPKKYRWRQNLEGKEAGMWCAGGEATYKMSEGTVL